MLRSGEKPYTGFSSIVLSVLSDIAMACRQIKNEKNKIKNPIRLTIVSCYPAHFDNKMSICYRNISIDENPNRLLDAFPIHLEQPQGGWRPAHSPGTARPG